MKEKKGLASRVKKIFQKEPQLPLQVEDLSKITLDWLAQHIPEDMLRKIEQQRLEEEGRKPENRYLPDSRMAIYDFCAKPNEIESFKYEDKTGNKQEIRFSPYIKMSYIPIYLDQKNKDRMTITVPVENLSFVKAILEYAMFLDNIFETNFANDLGYDYGEFIQNPKSVFKIGYIGCDYTWIDLSANSKLCKNLKKVLTEYQKSAKNQK